MPIMFPIIRVGDPLRCEKLSVFPLFTEPAGRVEYALSDQAIEAGIISVEEISESGSVPELLVENKGEALVLFLEGEQLIGAKQNRILNASVLIAAGTKTKIPVSCVEAGRWNYKSRKFGSSGTHSPSKLRRLLKASVTGSLKAKRGYRSDQGAVWAEVSRQQTSLGTPSGTSAMSDTFAAYQEQIADYREKLSYVEGATGVAIALGEKVVALDLFDKPAICEKVWDRLLTGVVLDALELEADQKSVETLDVDRLLAEVKKLAWGEVDPVGEGQQWRAESNAGDHASALSYGDVLVHGSVICH